MKLPLYFISDVHFQMTKSDQEKLRRQKMYSLFQKIKDTGGTLIIGGDFFDFWYDYGYYIPPEYNDIFDELDKLNQSGVKIHYIAGNHDFWDFGFFEKCFRAKFYKNDLVFTIKGQSILVTHGDGILARDKYYRLLKSFLRSRINIFLFKLLPAKLGCALAKIVSQTDDVIVIECSLSLLIPVGSTSSPTYLLEYNIDDDSFMCTDSSGGPNFIATKKL